MNVLVDTHAVLWWLAGDKQLSRVARQILENPANRRIVSVAALWEIAIKIGTGKLPVRGLTLSDFSSQLRKQEFILLSIRLEDLLRLEQLPPIHRDPFDRILVAQAIEEHISLLTADPIIAAYPVETIW